MPVDGSSIGRVTMEALSDIEEEYGEYAELVRCMLLVEIKYPSEEDVQKMNTTVMWADDEASPAARMGLVLLVLRGLMS